MFKFKYVYFTVILWNRWGGGEFKGNTVLNFNKVLSWKCWCFRLIELCNFKELIWKVLYLHPNSVLVITGRLILWCSICKMTIKIRVLIPTERWKAEGNKGKLFLGVGDILSVQCIRLILHIPHSNIIEM